MAMYRNYDGHGGQFGATSIGAASSNAGVNVYGASDSATSPTTLWVMLVNVSGQAQNGLSVAVENFSPSAAKVFQMTNGGRARRGGFGRDAERRVGHRPLAAERREVKLIVLTK